MSIATDTVDEIIRKARKEYIAQLQKRDELQTQADQLADNIARKESIIAHYSGQIAILEQASKAIKKAETQPNIEEI